MTPGASTGRLLRCRKFSIFPGHIATRHQQKFVHVGRASYDFLGPLNDNAFAIPLNNVNVRIQIRLAGVAA